MDRSSSSSQHEPPPRQAGRRSPEPSAFAWLIAAISLILPWIGGALCLYGAARMLEGTPGAWIWLAAGLALVLFDIVIDFVWADPSVSRSQEPDLNAGGQRLVGRTAVVVEAISDGRGAVQIGDTRWMAEGPDAPIGARVRFAATRHTLLIVEQL